MNQSEFVEKRKQIFESFECGDLKRFQKLSEDVLAKQKHVDKEQLFRTSSKILHNLSNLKEKQKLMAIYPTFLNWFDFSFHCEQKLLTKNNILYYALLVTKNLIAEKLYDLALNLADKLQTIYPFLYENYLDSETERYIRFMAPLCYNNAVARDLVSQNIQTSMALFLHGIKFYLKVLSSFYILLGSIRIYEANLIKAKKFYEFYDELFDFLFNSIDHSFTNSIKSSSSKNNRDEASNKLIVGDGPITIADNADKLNARLFLFRFLLIIHLQYRSIGYSSPDLIVQNQSQETVAKNKLLFDRLRTCVNRDMQYLNAQNGREELSIYAQFAELFDLIGQFSEKFKKDASSHAKTSGKANTLKENSAIEKKLAKDFRHYFKLVEKEKNIFFHFLLTNLFDYFFSAINHCYINQPSIHSLYLHDGLIDCLSQICFLYCESTKSIHALGTHLSEMTKDSKEKLSMQDLMPKYAFYKPLNYSNAVGRLAENLLRSNNSSSIRHSDLLKKSCESLLESQSSYLKWLIMSTIGSEEDAVKNYFNLDNLAIKMASQFYSEGISSDYVHFQSLAVEICTDRFKYNICVKQSAAQISTIQRTYHSACENMLLSLRTIERYDQARQEIKKIYAFFKSYNYDTDLCEIEWLVQNWCKIKRDMYKSKNYEYTQSDKRMNIAEYLKIPSANAFPYLFEELKYYGAIKMNDNNVIMNDETFYVLEKMSSLSTKDLLVKSRIQIELIQFMLNHQKNENYKFKKSAEDLLDCIENNLSDHVCLKDSCTRKSSSHNNSIDMLEENENKENDDAASSATKAKKRLSSPSADQLLEELKLECIGTPSPSTLNTTKRRRKIKIGGTPKTVEQSKSARSRLSNSKQQQQQHCTCDCLQSKVIHFQLSVFKFLHRYSLTRQTMTELVRNVVQTRLKIKDKTQCLTNTDNLHLQSSQTNCLVCPELCDEQALRLDFDKDLISKDLVACVSLLKSFCSRLADRIYSSEECDRFLNDKLLKKQFYDSIDILAQLFYFFGLGVYHTNALELKYEIQKLESTKLLSNNESTSQAFDMASFAQTIVYLSKAYVNMNMCASFEQFSERLLNGGQALTLPTEKDHSIRAKNLEKLLKQIDENKYLKHKTEHLLTYHLCLVHYFILKKKFYEAIYTLKERVNKSVIMNGKQTAVYYEARYYLKYIQFLFSMANVSGYEKDLNKLLEGEIPLSLLEDCYVSVFSVAKYYILNAVEPHRTFSSSILQSSSNQKETENNSNKAKLSQPSSTNSLNNLSTPSKIISSFSSSSSSNAAANLVNANANSSASNTDETVFFDISNPECYKVLAECLDMLQVLCKYFIEISRYRDATGYLREGLDITQLHYSTRRCVGFLLNQINADIIALCFSEASQRLKLVKNFFYLNNEEKLEFENVFDQNDLTQYRNYIYMHYLELLKEIKRASVSPLLLSQSDTIVSQICEPEANVKDLIVEKTSLIKHLCSKNKKLSDFAKDILIDAHLISANYLINTSKSSSKAFIIELLKVVKNYISSSACGTELLSAQEKWQLADYYCCLFELDENKFSDYLQVAKDLLVSNPHPLVYRRVLHNLFKKMHSSAECTPHNDTTKISYLLETQSIALRHKALAIHMKHRHKNTIDLELSKKFIESIDFRASLDSVYINNLIEKALPTNLSIIALLLFNNDDLYLVRLEKSFKTILAKFKYSKKYSDEFRLIMIENDKSMKQSDRNKFWSSRNLLNKKLSNFLIELEENVFGNKKSLMLGSYLDHDLEKISDEFRREFKLHAAISNSSEEHDQLIRNLILGLEFHSSDEIRSILKLAFDKSFQDAYLNYFCEYLKPKLSGAQRKHVCLLIDKNLHQIPWESMPATKNQLITRMPSIHFLQAHLSINSFHVNKEKAFYIVDPGSDLAHTREKFSTFFQKRKAWQGIIGVAPNETQFKKALTEYELFIYTGHGSGSQYYPSDDVQKLRVQATSILMGCSSGNQYVMGEFEPYGTVLAYILAGCPCIVGNLWDVTDRDIDRLTEDFLVSWLEDHEANRIDEKNVSSICLHLTKARKACKMSYLNGSAPVVYGLPVDFK